MKAFIHPETGEILTREQWRQLGIKNDEDDSGSLSSSNASRQESAPAVLQGREIDLGNGNSAIIVDSPDSDLVETKAWFDEEGEVHFKCNH